MQMYPHWNARDNYRFGLKKKKRKREKGDDPCKSSKSAKVLSLSSLSFFSGTR
jgi:ABC-type sugar transport system ATPase subunit